MDASGCYQPIPTQKIDMLIAGTSCVDFSTLNNKKGEKTKANAFLNHGFSSEDLAGDGKGVVGVTQKFRDAVHEQLSPEGLESIGESMTTFLSTINFILHRRPRIVIFENVQTAPWKAMQNFWLPCAGYYAEYVKVDSKDFYVPQDRIRGYLIALDGEVFNKGKSDATAAQMVHRACQHVFLLKQRASASVLEFLLDDDDPNYLQARDEITRYGSHGLPRDLKRAVANKQVDWDFCQLRHAIYSQRWNLDTIRRFSKATLSHGRVVTIAPPANSWIDYWARETPRVIDLIDSLYQQLLTRAGCDMNYKAAMFNISQNLDRMPISIAKFGIAPIITPAGMPTLSNLARPLLGVECLTLQGIPKNRLRLAGESHRELRDLAGNAMTATVVGAVILATLMAAGGALSEIQLRAGREALPEASSSHVDFLDRGLKELPDWDLGNFRLDASSLMTNGGFKVCRCPLVGSHNRITYRCRCCGKLACNLCKANPPHDFERYNRADNLTSFADLKVHIQQCLPGVFNMTMQEPGRGFFPSMRERSVNQTYRDSVKGLLEHNVFYFSGIKVSTASVIVEYRSQHNVARLTLSKIGAIDWYIFPSSSEALGTSRIGARDRRAKPIAKGIFHHPGSTVDPEVAKWCVWEPVKHSWLAAVSVKNDDSFVLNHKTIQSMSSPPFHLEAHVRDTIRGRWHAIPQCGTAADGLYVRKCLPNQEKLLCFKDVDPVGHPIDDHYIISKDIELAETFEYRGDEVGLEIIKMANLGETVTVTVPGYWQPIYPWACFKTRVHTSKKKTDSFHLASCSTIAAIGPEPESCCVTPALTVFKFRVFLSNLPLSVLAKERWTHTWYHVPATEMDEFFRSILFTANALEKGQVFKPDSDLSFDPLLGVPVQLCPDCCIEPPQLHWVKGNHHVVPWEDPSTVRDYQTKVKAMPEPFVARVSLSVDSDLMRVPCVPPNDLNKLPKDSNLCVLKDYIRLEYCHDLRVQLAVNPRTLASRAAANLAYGFRPRAFSPAILGEVQCFFQAEVGGLVGPNIRVNPFYNAIPTTEDSTGLRAVVPLTGDVIPASFLQKRRTLWEDQVRAVKWMLAREEAPAPYLETETEEQVLEAFNLRIVGRAAYPNDGSSFCCRGGIVAHEIGYGKTVVMIALLELRRNFDMEQSIVKRCEAADNFWDSELSFIHLKATLVIVPEHITRQWETEFENFGSVAKSSIVTIRRYPDLLRKRLSDLEQADVIIVATSVFNSPAYAKGLNLLMEDRPNGGKSDREVEARYRSSLDTIRQAVLRYREVSDYLDDDDKENLANERAKVVVDELNDNYQALCQQWSWAGGRKEANKRQRQSKKKPSEEEDEMKAKKRAQAKPMWTATSFLENFSFARIVVDEFSYDNPGITLFCSNSLANAKWLLSGTPRCDKLADIVHHGRLLSVHVARPDPCVPTYLDPITVGPRNKPTAPTEEYRERTNHLRSHNFAVERHHAAETFIKHFMRQDKVTMAKFNSDTQRIDLTLPTLSQTAYGGLRYDLSVAQGNIFNLPFTLRRSLDVATRHSYSGDNAATGTKAADVMMASWAAVPMNASILKGLMGASDLELLTLKDEIKTAMDKLIWLCHRLPLVSAVLRDKYPRHHNMRTLVEDLFAAMADARDSWNKWPMAPFGGRDAFHQLTKAICPSSSFRHHSGGLEDWLKWRFTEAKSFWPDWYDMSDPYIDSLALPAKRDELVELATDVILLNISHPLGRSFERTGDASWLDSHAIALGRIMDERTRGNFLGARQAPAAEQARAASVRDTVPTFTTEQLIAFLKKCMKEKGDSFEPSDDTKAKMVVKTKQDLQRHCLRRNLKFADSNSAAELANKVLKHMQGQCTKKSDFMDKRGVISPRASFPIPNLTFDRRGGKTEAMLEEVTLTYNYLLNCREAWIHAFRRHRLYDFLRFVQCSHYQGHVEKYCDACLRRTICSGDTPGFVVLACGHWLCEAHKMEIDQGGALGFCPAVGCGAPCGLSQPSTIRLTEQDVLSCPDVWDPKGDELCAKGGKMPRIVSLIQNTPKDDKVVLFTFIEELAASVRDELVRQGVSVLSMVAADPDADLAEDLEEFKKERGAKVIIIDPTAEHAAGSNLTIANHVIFASPVLERDPFLRQMHYRQAVGRCLRQGQTKKVTIYTCVTKGTIDEEFYDSEEMDMS
jgi:site-specific DNA-cytosine methylase